MPIEWDETKFGTGLPDIDDQHKEWLRRFNDFDNAVTKGQGIDSIFDTLAFLVQFTEKHFSHEEERMSVCNCPVQAENRIAHNEFNNRLNDLLSWLEKTRPTAVEVFLLKKDLESWLTNHISTIDIRLRGCK